MKRTIKNTILRLLELFYKQLASLCNWKISLPMTDDAMQTITDAGYKQIPLLTSFPELQPVSKDLSIVVPVYNSERFLKRCIESLMNQSTVYDYEVICVNDGSSDGSLKILEALQHNYSDRLVVYTQQNGGIANARNKGIELANGEYVGFVDNDDTVSPLYVEAIVRGLRNNEADMCQVGHKYIFDIDDKNFDSDLNNTKVLDNDSSVNYINQISGFVWAGAYRKEIISKIRFNPGYWYEDMITKILLARKSKRTVIIKDCHYNYLMHGNNASGKLWNNANVKSLDQLFLPIKLYYYSNDVLKLPKDEILVCMVIHEICWQLPNRMFSLPTHIQRASFALLVDFIETNDIKTECGLNNWNKLLKACRNRQFYKWRYLAAAEKWKSKISIK